MTDVLDKLAARHARTRREKPRCPRCDERPTDARLMLTVKRTKPKDDGKQADETVITVTRTMCPECVAELFDQFLEHMPEPDPRNGGRP